jgi:hypothetical protein
MAGPSAFAGAIGARLIGVGCRDFVDQRAGWSWDANSLYADERQAFVR